MKMLKVDWPEARWAGDDGS